VQLGEWAHLHVRVANLSDALYDLGVSVVDAAQGSPLFVVAGPRTETVTMLPRSTADLQVWRVSDPLISFFDLFFLQFRIIQYNLFFIVNDWVIDFGQFTLVPLVCGQLPLPQIVVECKAFAGGAPLYDARDAGMCFVAPRLKDQMYQAPGALAT
jgi:hypothetical protein